MIKMSRNFEEFMGMHQLLRYGHHFFNDEEKMNDFFVLTKDEFLSSYSYLEEREYDLTLKLVKYFHEKGFIKVSIEYINKTDFSDVM